MAGSEVTTAEPPSAMWQFLQTAQEQHTPHLTAIRVPWMRNEHATRAVVSDFEIPITRNTCGPGGTSVQICHPRSAVDTLTLIWEIVKPDSDNVVELPAWYWQCSWQSAWEQQYNIDSDGHVPLTEGTASHSPGVHPVANEVVWLFRLYTLIIAAWQHLFLTPS